MMYETDYNAQQAGIRLLDVCPGKARVSMAVESRMLNSHGICHGGMVFTLADTAFAYACNSHNRVAVAQHCSITFLASAHEGDILTATARETAVSGKNGIYDIEVKDQNGRSIAHFRGNSRVLSGSVVKQQEY